MRQCIHRHHSDFQSLPCRCLAVCLTPDVATGLGVYDLRRGYSHGDTGLLASARSPGGEHHHWNIWPLVLRSTSTKEMHPLRNIAVRCASPVICCVTQLSPSGHVCAPQLCMGKMPAIVTVQWRRQKPQVFQMLELKEDFILHFLK